MDFDFYVAARRGRLVEFALQQGCPEELAGKQVDRILEQHRRKIQKAEDPDPIVHQALRDALGGAPVGEPSNGRGRLLAAAALLLTVGLAIGVGLNHQPTVTEPVPSLIGYQEQSAERLLEQKGYDVETRLAPVCRPAGIVLGTWPPPGEPVAKGGRVTLMTAKPPTSFCVTYFLQQKDAADFVRFAVGGPPPKFTDPVKVIVDNGDPVRLSGGATEQLTHWADAREIFAEVARADINSPTGMPQLTVISETPPPVTCNVARPPAAGERSALRVEIDPYPFGFEDCPLTIDLYQTDGYIDTVVVYTAKTEVTSTS